MVRNLNVDKKMRREEFNIKEEANYKGREGAIVAVDVHIRLKGGLRKGVIQEKIN